jgi:hypothetical protein
VARAFVAGGGQDSRVAVALRPVRPANEAEPSDAPAP